MAEGDLYDIHRSIGKLEGAMTALTTAVSTQATESRANRAELHRKVNEVNGHVLVAQGDTKALRDRIDIMEPVVQDYSFLKQRWKAYLGIAIAIWIAIGGILTPIVGGWLQHVLFGMQVEHQR